MSGSSRRLAAKSPPVASDADIRTFRRILFRQSDGTPLRGGWRRPLALVNRALGQPWRLRWAIERGLRLALLGTSRNGIAIAKRDGVGVTSQFVRIFAATMRGRFNEDEFYMHQLHLPGRRHWWTRQFASWTHTVPAQNTLIDLTSPPDLHHLTDKRRFAARCHEFGLPSVQPLAAFDQGRADIRETIPKGHLFSKPTNQFCGAGAAAWHYDEDGQFYLNPVTQQSFSADAFLAHLTHLSREQPILLQRQLVNHSALRQITNGALATLRIVTCLNPEGSFDMLPPVIRLPCGREVADNFAKGGLAAPIDFATGKISGAAVRKHADFGVAWHDRHPNTGQSLLGFQIPWWSESIALAERAHHFFPSVHFIGWDIAVVQDGPVLVEGNVRICTDVTVLPHQLPLGDTQFIPYFNHHWTAASMGGTSRR